MLIHVFTDTPAILDVIKSIVFGKFSVARKTSCHLAFKTNWLTASGNTIHPVNGLPLVCVRFCVEHEMMLP